MEDRSVLTPPASPATLASPAAIDAGALEFDHIGLIVADLTAARAFLEAALGIACWTPITDDPGIRVSVQFGSASDSAVVYELIAPLGEDSPIAAALRQGKSILNHVAYLTPDLAASAAHLRALGCFAAGEPKPALAYHGRLIQFWVSPLRFIIELIEKPGHRHPFSQPAIDSHGRTGS
jgi:methylmalonyl-CoA/ethylmalonyl-CoA epimerase